MRYYGINVKFFFFSLIFQQFYNDYGDIIKATLGKAREINKVICAKTMALSLTTLFDDLQRDPSTGVVNKYNENFLSIKVNLVFPCFSLEFLTLK